MLSFFALFNLKGPPTGAFFAEPGYFCLEFISNMISYVGRNRALGGKEFP